MNIEKIEIDKIFPHPKNYNNHPEDQIAHIIKSINEHGIYRPIVISKDNFILAGHGVYTACKKIQLKEVPIIRINIDSNNPKALKLVIGDNEISHLSEKDDYKITELLKEIMEYEKQLDKDIDALLGTGFDEKMLANLVYISRPENEIKDKNAAEHWVGMPEFKNQTSFLRMVVNFETKEDREDFAKKLKIKITEKTNTMWWPPKEKEDPSSVKFGVKNAK